MNCWRVQSPIPIRETVQFDPSGKCTFAHFLQLEERDAVLSGIFWCDKCSAPQTTMRCLQTASTAYDDWEHTCPVND